MTTMSEMRIRLMREMKEDKLKREIEPLPEVEGLAGRLLGWLPRLKVTRNANRQLKLVETLPLGGRQQLMLVTCAGEGFLVCVGANGVGSIVRVDTKGTVPPWV